MNTLLLIALLAATVERISLDTPLPLPQAPSIERIGSAPANEAETETIIVDAALFSVAALGQALANGTALTVRPIHADTPRLDRLADAVDHFYDHHAPGAIVLTMRSAWPADPLFSEARSQNIRVVEIDAARPLDDSGPGIALQSDAPENSYPWLSLNNLARMAEIIARDFARLAPNQTGTITANLNKVKQDLFVLQSEVAKAALEVEDPYVSAATPAFSYLLESAGFFTDEQLFGDAERLDWKLKKSDQNELERAIKVLISDASQPPIDPLTLSDATIWHIIALDPLAVVPPDTAADALWQEFSFYYRANLERLYP